jgi:hypothetical protein
VSLVLAAAFPSFSFLPVLFWAGVASVVGVAAFVALHPNVVKGVVAIWWLRKPLGWLVLLALAMAVGRSMAGGVVAPTSAGATTMSESVGPLMPPGHAIPMDARPLFPDVPAGGFPHDVYTWGNCTWWAAYNHPIPAWANPPGDGDAWRWYDDAVRDHIPVSNEPSVGAVVVYRAGPTYSSHGHVAIVVSLGVGVFGVSEMNFIGLNKVDERDSPWPDGNVAGFIPR